MLIYLDICCFNRPFDDQKQIRIRIETEAKLFIQEEILAGKFQLAWVWCTDSLASGAEYLAAIVCPVGTRRFKNWKMIVYLQQKSVVIWKQLMCE